MAQVMRLSSNACSAPEEGVSQSAHYATCGPRLAGGVGAGNGSEVWG